MEAQLEPLQNDATSGVGKTLIVPDPERIVRFFIRSKGPPAGGEITIECSPMKAPGSGTGPAQIVWRQMGGADFALSWGEFCLVSALGRAAAERS